MISTWQSLVDTDADATRGDTLLDLFGPPLLVLGLTGLADLLG